MPEHERKSIFVWVVTCNRDLHPDVYVFPNEYDARVSKRTSDNHCNGVHRIYQKEMEITC